MTPTDLHLIRSTFAPIAAEPDRFATAFRARAIELDRSLALHLPLADRLHARRIADTIATVLAGLDAADSVRAKEQAFALRHRWAGIQSRHYGVIGRAMLDGLTDALGASFSDAARAAWASAFVQVAEALMARSYNPMGLAA